MIFYRVILKTGLAFCFAASITLPANAQTVIPAGSTMTVPGTVLDLACTDLLVQGTFILGSAQINRSATVNIASSGQLNAGHPSSTVTDVSPRFH